MLGLQAMTGKRAIYEWCPKWQPEYGHSGMFFDTLLRMAPVLEQWCYDIGGNNNWRQ